MSAVTETAATRYPVVVVDDHPLVRTALATALRDKGLWVVECPATTPKDVTARIAELPVGLALLDIDLGPGQEDAGARITPRLVASGWRVLVVTGARESAALTECIAAGAIGWVQKSRPFNEVVDLVCRAVDGHEVMSEAERSRLLHDRQERDGTAGRLGRLSHRERQVLGRLAEGLTAREIAAESVVSLHTVRTQIRSILSKLEVSSQLAAVALLRRRR